MTFIPADFFLAAVIVASAIGMILGHLCRRRCKHCIHRERAEARAEYAHVLKQ